MLFCCAVSGCSFDGSNELGSVGVDAGRTGPQVDATIAPQPDAGQRCRFEHKEICESGEPLGNVVIDVDQEFDTTTDTRCRNLTLDGVEHCLVFAESFTLVTGVSIRVIGELPLIVASNEAIELKGNIDASSKINTEGRSGAGPGASTAQCAPGLPAISDRGGSGGGSGGSYSGKGGNGGFGDTNNNGEPAGMAGGGNAANGFSFGFRAGCPGSQGGESDIVDSTVAPGGIGGGALVFISVQRISQGGASAIEVGGSGGRGGRIQGGGGGGGSGGLIYFEAPQVKLDGLITAGGGGGGGGGVYNGGAAENGLDATLEFNSGSGGGGASSDRGIGGTGGNGAANSDLDGQRGIDSIAGGGGGGGGAGYIIVSGELSGTVATEPDITVL